jgi:hypothetical protein
LWIQFPDIRPLLTRGEEESYNFGFGGGDRVLGASYTYLSAATWSFWILGLILQARRPVGWSDLRTATADFALILATAALCYTVPRMATVWALGVQSGYLPLDPFGDYGGNHGPWRHVYHLRLILEPTLLLPAFALFLAIVSVLVRPSRGGWTTAVLAFLAFHTLMITHYWLID